LNKKFLVIGSNSFSGSHFVNFLLDKKIEVVGLSRSKEINPVFLKYKKNFNINKFKFYKLDINNNLNFIKKVILNFKPTHIVNFASQSMVAESWLYPNDWYRTNVISQIKLFDFLKNLSFIKKYVHISTPEVYGNTTKEMKEHKNYSPSTPYAISRAACDMHLSAMYINYKFPVVFTRAANVYGPGQQLYRIIPKTIICALKDEKLYLHGGGKSKRSFIHIDDVVRATYKVAISGKLNNVYHISTNKEISIKDLVNKLIKLLNKDPKKLIKKTKDRAGKDMLYSLSSEKIKKELKFIPEVKLDFGLNETISWIMSNFKILRKINPVYKHKK
jgi:dTDP-glucose 4,6-dehydratase